MRPRAWRGVEVLFAAVHARSRGRVALRSADPRARPAIDPGYLAAEADVDVLAAGLRQAREIAARAPLSDHIAGEFAPGPEVDDDETARAWIRRTVLTVFHPTSS